jgi:alpha-L-fucosidase
MKKYSNWPESYPDTTWFTNARFGAFIHFGLYTLGARHEWFMTTEQVTPENYRKYFEHFDPDLFDANQWAQEIKATGAEYVVFTTKHHEGFAFWDTKQSDYKITNTPFGRDLLAELLPAFRKVGLKIGLYHSLIDWYHPEFPIDGLHPCRDEENYRATNDQRDLKKYQDFLAAQVTELLTEYGKIDYMWFDFSYAHRDWGWSVGKGATDWDALRLEKICRTLQPEMLINDRFALGHGITTPEQYQPDKPLYKDGLPVLWEACQTMNGTWGYDRDNQQWKSSEQILQMLIDTVAKGGNFLMNTGPNGRGLIDKQSKERFSDLNEWFYLHNRSIKNCGPSEFVPPIDCRYTQNGNRLYLHIFSWPYFHIHLKDLAGKIRYAQFLNDGSEVFYRGFDPEEVITTTETIIEPNDIVLQLPTTRPDSLVPVIEIFLND